MNAALAIVLSLAAAPDTVIVEVDVQAVGLEARAERDLVSHLEEELELIGVRVATRRDAPTARLILRATRVGPLLRADLELTDTGGGKLRETRNARVDQAVTSTLVGPETAARLRALAAPTPEEEAGVSDEAVAPDSEPVPGVALAPVGPAAGDAPSVEEDEAPALPLALTIGGAGVASLGALALAVGSGTAAHEVGVVDDARALRGDKDRALALAPVALGVAAVGGALLLSGGAVAGVGAFGL